LIFFYGPVLIYEAVLFYGPVLILILILLYFIELFFKLDKGFYKDLKREVMLNYDIS